MKKILFSAFAFFVTCNLVNAQFDYNYDNVNIEVGAHFGSMHSITDVGGEKGLFINQIKGKQSHAATGAFIAANFQSTYGARLEATWGTVSGDDAKGKNPERGLYFRSAITEIALIGELHPMQWFVEYEEAPIMSPYLNLGAGWFSFNPQGRYQGRLVDLRPLSTGGQGFPEFPDRDYYKLNQANIIYGLGVKFNIEDIVSVRCEALGRKLFTDYLDDASGNYINPAFFDNNFSPEKAAMAKELANPNDIPWQYKGNYRGKKNKDAYLTFSLKVSVNLGDIFGPRYY